MKENKDSNLKQKGYKQIECLSDLAVEVWGRNIEELFKNAACSMFSIICRLDLIKGNFKKEIIIKRKNIDSKEDLLIVWLNKLLYFHETKKVIFSDFQISKIFISNLKKENCIINALCTGDIIDLRKHEIYTNIKAATYHDIKIHQDSRSGFLKTKIIFDV